MCRLLFASFFLLVSYLVFETSLAFSSLAPRSTGTALPISPFPWPVHLPIRPRIHYTMTQQQRQQESNLKRLAETTTTHQQSTILFSHKDGGKDDSVDSSAEQQQRPSRIRRLVRRVLVAAYSVGGFWFVWQRGPLAAHAKFSYEIRENPTVSIRPGMNQEQAEIALQTGEITSTTPSPTTSSGVTTTTSSKSKATSKKSDSVYGENDDDEDEDAFFEEEDVISPFSSSSTSGSTVGSQSDRALAARLASKTSRSFASYNQGRSRSVALTTQVALALFVPTFGGMFVREFLRRRREEEYVRKGLEILEAQKAEYFNVTSTTADSDVQDALKGLKNGKNQTKASDDDDDDDDEDDDDDDDEEDDKPQDRRRRPPRPPTSPKDDAGGRGTSGPKAGGDDPGYGKASDEDIDKLKRLMGRS